jgi:hypothetical protein
MVPLLGFLSDAKEAFTELVTGLLMVAGGFLVGYVLGGVLAWAAGRYVFKQQDTTSLKRLGRPVGGVVLALIVALIVFTGKGKPHGEGGDGKGDPDTDPNAPKSGTPPASPPKIDPKVVPPKTPEVKPAEATIRVTILGGNDVREGRFYLIDDDPTPKTFEEFKRAVTARKAMETGKLMVAILFPEKNALPLGHPAVVDVSRWAKEEAKLDVLFPAGGP